MAKSIDSSPSEVLSADNEQWEGRGEKKEMAIWKVAIIAWSLQAVKTRYNKDTSMNMVS